MYKGKNVLLRAFSEDDAKYVCELKTDFIALKAFGGRPFPNNLAGEKEWISKMYPAGLLNSIILVVEEIVTKQFVGYVAASKIDYINSNAYVGIIFHKNFRGKGYYKEASILFYSYLFNEINLHKVYSGDLTYNSIAIENDKKIGFTVDGVMKEHIYQSGKYHDMYIVSLTKKDFFSKINLEEYLNM
jgi:RimJ/RimL family protein N-acetyltransferase